MTFGSSSAFAELVGNFPAGDLEQPAFEGVFGRVVLEGGNFLGHSEEDILKGFFRFVFGERGAAGDAQDEPAVGLVEFRPAGMVRVFNSVEETGARRQWVVIHGGLNKNRVWHIDQPRAGQKFLQRTTNGSVARDKISQKISKEPGAGSG
jgi:hypothetical protein